MNHYTHKSVSSHSYVITEDYGINSRYTIGLFEGENSAAVIDSGWGLTGNLRKYIEDNITAKPLICLLTHPHPDHVGASVQFERVFMNPVDEGISKHSCSLEKRLGDMKVKFGENQLYKEMEAEATEFTDFIYSPLVNGQSFDLGGIRVQALSLPGHTPGSMVFYCEEEKTAFVGDTIGNRVMFLQEDSDIALYISSLRDFISVADADTQMFGGHSQEPMRFTLLADILRACENVLSGNASPKPADLPPFLLESMRGKSPLSESVGNACVIYI